MKANREKKKVLSNSQIGQQVSHCVQNCAFLTFVVLLMALKGEANDVGKTQNQLTFKLFKQFPSSDGIF